MGFVSFCPCNGLANFPIPHAAVRNQQVTFGRVASLLGKEPLFGSICATIVQPARYNDLQNADVFA